MLTAALILLALLLLVALGVVLLWRAAALSDRKKAEHIAALELLVRHQCDRIAGYRAELDALSLTAPPAAVAALTPDDPALLPPEVEQWLRNREMS